MCIHSTNQVTSLKTMPLNESIDNVKRPIVWIAFIQGGWVQATGGRISALCRYPLGLLSLQYHKRKWYNGLNKEILVHHSLGDSSNLHSFIKETHLDHLFLSTVMTKSKDHCGKMQCMQSLKGDHWMIDTSTMLVVPASLVIDHSACSS